MPHLEPYDNDNPLPNNLPRPAPRAHVLFNADGSYKYPQLTNPQSSLGGAGVDVHLLSVDVVPAGEADEGKQRFNMSNGVKIIGPEAATPAATVGYSPVAVTLTADVATTVPVPATWASLLTVDVLDNAGNDITDQVHLVRSNTNVQVTSAVTLTGVTIAMTGLLA